MIGSFRHKGLGAFFATGKAGRLSVQNVGRVSRILRALDAAESPADLDLPGFRFHALKGELSGRYAVSVSGNWRITFAWSGQKAVEVDLEDYH
ncbi:proteic killer suppression protein [Tistlia consotensis]|uniref:Proteic killer suppression protein n=1 Tax=Tistlia consotensis USBA 355 TaxID=560819 RepID=A0A1Y6CI02_9PROT|nr:type II toxin-antitoxin system RelE/ParE family toxin [Tistlia consotensis]SMF65370.1 proteic killer suppression protein [Tistlia consotensis USBA 355]SNS03797.1 proteic killer suppression protein [Tistlia consotensis]